MVDDQASLKIQNINRQFTAMGNQVGTTQGRINSFNSAINTNSRTFTASANAIKTQGNALANNTKNIAANSTQFTTLGSKVKATASQFAGMATGLAVTASGALQLAAGFRDYNDAQIAVDRVTRKLSLATEAQHKAQDKLQKLQDKGVRSGKEYAQAQLDVSQANAAVSIQTDLLGEAQERMFDSQTQFVASVIPTTLGALGTLGSAFKDLGGTKGLGGLADKFKGLGAASGLLKGGMAGLLTTLGPLALIIGGIAAALLYAKGTAEVAAKAMDEFRAAAKLEDVTKSIQGMNAALDKLKLTPGIGSLKEIGDLIASLGAGGLRNNFVDMAKKMAENAKIAASNVGKLAEAEKKLDADEAALANKKKERQTTSVKNEVKHMEAVVADDKAEVARLKTVQKVNDIKGKSNTLSQEELNILGRAKEAKQQQLDWQVQLSANYELVMEKTKAAADNAAREALAIKLEDDAMKNILPNIVKMGEAHATAADQIKLVGDMEKLTKDRMGEWNTAIDQVAIHNQEAEASFKNLAKTMKDDLAKAAADAQAAIDKMRGGVQSGLDKIIEAFHKVHKKGKLDFEVNFDKAKKGFDKFLAEVGDKLDHGGSANAQKYILAFAEKGTAGMSKSSARMFQPLFDWIEKHKDEPADVFMSGFLQMLATFDPKVSQQFKKLIDPSIGLAGEIGKKAGKEFSEELMAAINSTLKIADRFANIGGHPGRGSLKDTTPVKIQTEFIPPKTPVPTPKTPVKVPSTFIPPPPPPAPKEQVKVPSVFIPPPPIPSPKTPVKVPAVLELATNFNLAGLWESAGIKKPVTVPARLGFGPSQGGNLKPGVNEFTTGTSHGNNSPSDIQARMRIGKVGPAEGAQQGTQPGDDLAEFWTGQMTRHGNRPVPIIPNKPPTSNFFPASSGGAQVMSNAKPQINIEMALKQIDVIAKRIMGLSTIMPVLTLNNAAAIKAIDVIAVRLVSLTKVAPTITLINAKAIKAIDVIATRIMSLTGIAPAISLTNTLAFKIVDAVAKRIISLEKIKPNISISNTQALKIVDTVGKRIDSLEKIKPSISLSNSQAIKAVDVVAKRINSLSNIKATVHVGLSGPGASLASKGDTSSKFDLAGSKADSGGGDTIVNLNISGNEIVNEQRITRRVKRSMGSDRFVYGV